MGDTVDVKTRSAIMSRVRAKDTVPEMKVRRMVFTAGFRYRLHVRDLPGKPDLVFSRRRKVIFVHGCFWHRHKNCALARLPKSRIDFWTEKLESNRRRDERNQSELLRMGWKVLTIWECELNDLTALEAKVERFLNQA